jgi:hypothetical protein
VCLAPRQAEGAHPSEVETRFPARFGNYSFVQQS